MTLQEPKVLIVDDEKDYLADFLALFSRKFGVVAANSSEEALAILEKGTVGVVITDQRMPRKTGSQLLTEIRQRFPHTVRILLTGYCDMEALVEAINEGGIFYYLKKDAPLSQIEVIIRQALEKFKSEEAVRQKLKSLPS